MSKKLFNHIIIGAGIAGCSTAYFLGKEDKSVLLLDRNCDVAQGASGAAGAFLSPLLGKPNEFKDLVTEALKFSTKFYKENIPEEITNCGVVRIPKNNEDREKFESYKPYMDFDFSELDDGYFFEIGSQVNSYEICKALSKDVEKKFNCEVGEIKRIDGVWHLNDELQAKNLIITSGADISLIKEEYFNIRAVWGQKIDIYTTNCIDKNYHKACSLSHSKKSDKEGFNKVSIGATHHRFNCDLKLCNHCIKTANINKMFSHSYGLKTINSDTEELLKKANDIQKLNDAEVCDIKIGARASSVDYFPMVGKMVDSLKTVEEHPHFANGTFVKDEFLSMHENLFVINGVGGRGFVLSPYLAKILVDNILKNNEIQSNILTNRLFKRWVKKYKKQKSES